MNDNDKIRVLVVDDSALVRTVISRVLKRDPAIEIAGVAADAYEARDKILELRPSVVTLDIDMPRMDGLTFLRILMKHHPMPVVIVSALTQEGSAKAFEAIEAGAVDVLGKPTDNSRAAEFEVDLVNKVKSAAFARVSRAAPERAPQSTAPADRRHGRTDLILLGASTGGVEALKEVLIRLPNGLPPICIVQHIPAYISSRFASRLNDLCALEVREAQNGDALQSGLALVAPGGLHMAVRRHRGHYEVELLETARVHHQRPAVDVLFESAAACVGPRAIAVLLTGMGKDGAEGMLKLKRAGATTIAQNEETCVVYGMPRAAVELGAVDYLLPLPRIGPAILNCLGHAAIQS